MYVGTSSIKEKFFTLVKFDLVVNTKQLIKTQYQRNVVIIIVMRWPKNVLCSGGLMSSGMCGADTRSGKHKPMVTGY